MISLCVCAFRLVFFICLRCALLLVPLVLATTWELVSRYALQDPTIWAYEIGYTLTGHTSEKIIVFLHGAGNNGKTTFLTFIYWLLEEFASRIQIDSLTKYQSHSANAQADMADLRGARFVMTSEPEQGERLAEATVKRITQGMGKIKAVRKYENPIEFPETHKLWMDTNSKPTIRAADDQATFNRLHPIPFTVTIPPETAKADYEVELAIVIGKRASRVAA